jgi:catechol-2,3-dioxygenase
MDSINDLRVFHKALQSSPTAVQAVSHGTTWSLYFRDPEENRIELFTDTPWHVNQPCKFEINLDLSNQDLLEFTKKHIKALSGFSNIEEWTKLQTQSFDTDSHDDTGIPKI